MSRETLEFLENGESNHPVIRNDYISIIQRCIFEDREKKKNESKRNDGSETDINPSELLP